jgi:hypothetical protein
MCLFEKQRLAAIPPGFGCAVGEGPGCHPIRATAYSLVKIFVIKNRV